MREVNILEQKPLIYRFFSQKGRKMLIILDACRLDFIEKNLYILRDFPIRLSKVLSSGSCTKEWLENTFTKPLPQVIYISANPWIHIVPRNFFKKIIDLSINYWDKSIGTVRAENVNLVSLKYLLRGEDLIVHYLQPHAPFVCDDSLIDPQSKPTMAGYTIYKLASRYKEFRKKFIFSYDKNMEYVLKHVKKLVRAALRFRYNIVITADHSELLGVYAPISTFKAFFRKNILKFLKSWLPYLIGVYKVVGHPCKWDSMDLRIVPWIEIYNKDGD